MADEKQAGPVLSFNNIALGGKSGGLKGQLKVTSTGFSWKAATGKSISLPPSDVSRYDWTFVGPLYQLKLGTKGDASVRFDGFREKDIEALRTFISAHFNATVNVAEQALMGRNWGDVEFSQNGSSLAFKHQTKQLFEIPLSDVAQATLASKNDVAVEFHLDDTTAALEHDFLSEIRFYIPADKEKKDKAEGEDKNGEPEQSAAERFQKRILAKADVISYAGSGIVVFKDLTLVFPRGKYEVELYGTFLRLHGKSYDYKVLYSNIPRLFQLTRSDDDRHVYVVVSLDQPIKQGQTRYPHLVFQFTKADDEMELTVNLDEENQRKYKDKIGKTMKGKPQDIFIQAFKALADKKVTLPGAFRSHDKRNAIKCSVKANEGILYPLERSLFFIPKPPIHVHFDEIAFVEFSRVSSQGSTATTRNFDLIIALKGGSTHQFTNVMRQEFQSLCNYFKSKEIKIKGLNNVTAAAAARDSDEEGQGREARKVAQAAMREGAESDSDEEDDDFVAPDEDDVPEEYESGPESVGSPSESGEEASGDEKKEKKKEKKEKKKEKKDKEKKHKEKKDKGEKKKKEKDEKAEKIEKTEKKEKGDTPMEDKKNDHAAGDKRKHSDDEKKEGKKVRKEESDD